MNADEADSLRTDCLKACRDGNLERVKELLAQGLAINGEVDGWTGFLSAAVHEGQAEVGLYLLDNGASVVRDCDSQMGACNYGEAKLLERLLEHGANPNFKYSPTGETMLHLAAMRGFYAGSTDCVRLLLEAGANPNVHCKSGIPTPALDFGTKVTGETPLHWAAVFGSEEMIELLVKAGADITATNAHGEIPLMWYGRHQRRRPHIKLERGAGKLLEPASD